MEFKVISVLRRLCDYERDISELLHGFYEREPSCRFDRATRHPDA